MGSHNLARFVLLLALLFVCSDYNGVLAAFKRDKVKEPRKEK